MKTHNKLIITGALALIIGVVGTYAFQASPQDAGPGFGPRFMSILGHSPGMMGRSHHMAGAGPNSATPAEMGIIHELIVNHDRISRTVSNLPDGIRTVTESDDPRIARYLKEHVASMRERVSAGNDPGLPIESPALRAIFRNKDKIRTTVETTHKGIVVVQTSSDKETVAVLQQHAAEVSDLVRYGMLAVRTAMMRNGVMMHGESLHEGMHGEMMRGMPNGSGAQDTR